MQQYLSAVSETYGLGTIRGNGLLLALDTKQIDAGLIVKCAFDRGLLLNTPRSNTLRFMPALTVTTAEIKQMIDLLDRVLSEISQT